MTSKKVVASPESIACSDVYPGVLDSAAAKGYFATPSNVEVCQRAQKGAIIIAVKPNVVTQVFADILRVPESKEALVISVAAGVTLETLEHGLPGRRVVRVMPNTACTVAQSASGYALGALCTDQDRDTVQAIFGSVGVAFELPEFLLNAVTGLSGSGPAYVFAI